jgi:hypothetical protein|tara:strand:- start:7278 stop:7403 length:126 start_codon:yes stop_codon:yes gene_type:complete
MIIQVPYHFEDFKDLQELWAYLAISAIQAGYTPMDIIIGLA